MVPVLKFITVFLNSASQAPVSLTCYRLSDPLQMINSHEAGNTWIEHMSLWNWSQVCVQHAPWHYKAAHQKVTGTGGRSPVTREILYASPRKAISCLRLRYIGYSATQNCVATDFKILKSQSNLVSQRINQPTKNHCLHGAERFFKKVFFLKVIFVQLARKFPPLWNTDVNCRVRTSQPLDRSWARRT